MRYVLFSVEILYFCAALEWWVTVCVAYTLLGQVIAVVGSCEALGSWCYYRAVILQPVGDDG